MSHRLTPDRAGKAEPLSLRLTPELAEALEQVRAELAAATPAGIIVTKGDAARALFAEGIAARRARLSPPAPPPPSAPLVAVAPSDESSAEALTDAAEAAHAREYQRVRDRLLAARKTDGEGLWTYEAIAARLKGKASRSAVAKIGTGKPVNAKTLAAVAKILPP